MKYTPGPWVASKTGRGIGPVSKEDGQSYGMIIEVAFVEFDPEIEVQVANAKLIAAAPELFEALQKAISTLEDMRLDVSEASVLIDCRAAIAKAIGKEE